MDDILKANFKLKNPVTTDDIKKDKREGHVELAEEFRTKALASLGGSMIYVERNKLAWDGENE